MTDRRAEGLASTFLISKYTQTKKFVRYGQYHKIDSTRVPKTNLLY